MMMKDFSVQISCPIVPNFRSFKEKNGANSRLTSMHHFYLFIRKIIVVER